MYRINANFLKYPGAYLFLQVAKKREAFAAAHPDRRIISLGVGDVTLPLAPAVVSAMEAAVQEMSRRETFRGYPPTPGYPFLKEKILAGDFAPYGVHLEPEEIFINDGAKGDLGNLGDILSGDDVIAVCDPTYPAYVDSNVVYGRCGEYDAKKGQWGRVIYLPCVKENGFVPELPAERPDVLYLCVPNNPTGAAITRAQLQRFVDYALENGCLIVYDAAYEGFIASPDVPHTVYECAGAKRCAIEVRSFSKTAGFTGCRLGYMAIPMELEADGVKLNALWRQRLAVKSNGVPYVIQRGGEAVYSPEGRAQTRAQIAYYKKNAAAIRDGLRQAGYEAFGGTDSPYVWLRTLDGRSAWEFFDLLLERANVVGTPGSGFGPSGEGYFRLTGFGTWEDTAEALDRIRSL